MIDMSIYTREILLRSEDVDMHRRLRTSVLFRLLQEASIRHTEELGMGREKTLDKGLLWILTHQRAEIERMPVYDEKVVLKSWPGKSMHLLFPRYYSLETEEGEPLLKASAIWCLMDSMTRKIAFPETYGIVIDGLTTGEEIKLPSAMKRLECTEERRFRVPYSYVDLNGHMNNTRYFDLAEDTAPGASEGRPLKLIESEYVNEARYGEELTVRWGTEGCRTYMTGENGKTVFRMAFTYGE